MFCEEEFYSILDDYFFFFLFVSSFRDIKIFHLPPRTCERGRRREERRKEKREKSELFQTFSLPKE